MNGIERRVRELEARRPRVQFKLCGPPDPTKPRPTVAGKSDLIFRFVDPDPRRFESFHVAMERLTHSQTVGDAETKGDSLEIPQE